MKVVKWSLFAVLILQGLVFVLKLPAWFEIQKGAKARRAKREVGLAAEAAANYHEANRDWPKNLAELTTPVAYMEHPALDSFSKPRGSMPYQFETADENIIVWSLGPDRDMDIDPELYLDKFVGYNPPEELLHVTYDATNGTVSDGDIWVYR